MAFDEGKHLLSLVKSEPGHPGTDSLLRYLERCTVNYLTISRIEVIVIRLKIEELKPGMNLARSVYNQQDLMLLEKGTSLTKKRIWMLKTWGIDQVSVKGKSIGEGKGDFEAEIETKETIETELKAKFADVIDEPIMQEIMKAAGRQLQKSLIDQKKKNEPT
jgi:hypothetical protein